jgi:1,4-dihydroxy-2-naphthoyl-CoA synthase
MTSVEAVKDVFEGVRYPGIDEFVRRSRKPIIAAVKGYAIGGGHHIAYNCDFTIAADNAIFGQVGPRIGSPADGWIVSNLNRVVGTKKAREIWMLCRQYTAQEALAMGLVNTVVPLEKFDEEVDRWCEEVLGKSPTCIQVLKACFDSDIDYLDGSSRRFSNRMAPEFLGSEEHKEATEANRERRKPNFWKSKMPKDE